ncbi:hypothetical protein [Sphingobacterium bovistauri]|uniref:DUF4466 domain-containing protein n=1 Tax=Sphingobacterium bovistauri TaxID=2781959 RepID=A0ABS7Z3H6_9SPHI|nr:hypothetical protein [Sphingobacterium bovistauri]MCA5004702.1 hypothetical protein [Sphingobacterium bovistauri]
MKKIQLIKMLSLMFIGSSLTISCVKDQQNIFNMFDDLSVEFMDKGTNSFTTDGVLNDGDSAYIHFRVISQEEMTKISVDSTLGNGQIGKREIILKQNEKNSYSGVIKHKMKRDGKITFRIYAYNRLNQYIGDGYKSITLEGKPSYIHLPNRHLYAPFEGDNTRKSFYSILDGTVYDYTGGKANSSKIDFGVYTLLDTRPTHINRFSYNLYSINVTPNPNPTLDISDWEKRTTLFSAPITSSASTFTNVLVSSSTIETEAKKRAINLTKTSVTDSDKGLAAGNMVYFLTPEGKYGALYVNQVTTDTQGFRYLSISTKIQK